jgi:hypothetical protein
VSKRPSRPGSIEEQVALVWSRKIHPDAELFRYLPIGAWFRFAVADSKAPSRKTASGWYETAGGRKFRTGPLVAVIPLYIPGSTHTNEQCRTACVTTPNASSVIPAPRRPTK